MSEVISIDPQILGGTPVFRGTRVPLQTLIDYFDIARYVTLMHVDKLDKYDKGSVMEFWKRRNIF